MLASLPLQGRQMDTLLKLHRISVAAPGAPYEPPPFLFQTH